MQDSVWLETTLVVQSYCLVATTSPGQMAEVLISEIFYHLSLFQQETDTRCFNI